MFYPIEADFRITDFYSLVFDRRFPEEFIFEGEKHNFWESVYVVDGKVEVTENEKVYIMGPRDIIFHAPNEFHRLRSAEKTCPRVLNLSFRISGNLPNQLKNGVMHLSPSLHEEYTKIVSMLQNCIQNTSDFFEVSMRLSAFFMRLFRESHTKDSLSTSSGALAYKSLVESMYDEVYSNLTLEEFAKKSFISVSYIKKLFNHYTGISPKRYYANLRVLEAQKLLLAGMPVSVIAEKMNFSSTSYFTTFFKIQTGYTPVQFRKLHEI